MNRKLLHVLSGAIAISVLASLPRVPTVSFGGLESLVVYAQVQPEMTLERLDAILREAASEVEGEAGQWQVTLEGQTVLVLADETNNRMRIVTPIVEANTLSVEQVGAMLIANFHSALDARYAVTQGAVVAMYVHPLGSLQEADLRSGLGQVASLAATFGTSYSSGELGFGPAGAPPQDQKLIEGEVEI